MSPGLSSRAWPTAMQPLQQQLPSHLHMATGVQGGCRPQLLSSLAKTQAHLGSCGKWQHVRDILCAYGKGACRQTHFVLSAVQCCTWHVGLAVLRTACCNQDTTVSGHTSRTHMRALH
jgi:hypothetical protein